jgi:D12 class N6 adenine-specific DNA methyltransferase
MSETSEEEAPTGDLRAPMPYFGGKRRVAPLIWSRFGNTSNYVEPFAGSLAVLLARPHAPKTETVNDLSCFISNFWRALQHDPDAVAHYADWPVNEADLYARHLWLVTKGVSIVEQIRADPDWYDVKIAGWFVWGSCCWIGAGWCAGASSWGKPFADGELCHDRRPALNNPNGHGILTKACPSGVSAKIPHLGDAGLGLHRGSIANQIPALDPGGRGAFRASGPEKGNLYVYMRGLAARLRRVRVCCGDWSRVMGPTVTEKHGTTAIMLDPPYDESERVNCYSTETPGVAADVRAWCLANGDNPLLRIAYCSYGEADPMPGWERVKWAAAGGYGSQGNGRGRANAKRETIDFSPACLKPKKAQTELFGEGEI